MVAPGDRRRIERGRYAARARRRRTSSSRRAPRVDDRPRARGRSARGGGSRGARRTGPKVGRTRSVVRGSPRAAPRASVFVTRRRRPAMLRLLCEGHSIQKQFTGQLKGYAIKC
eukprot:30018-Pelagococcus_subviridis.AAC.3